MPIFGTVESHIDTKNRIIVKRLFKNEPMEDAFLIGETINSNMLRFYLVSKLYNLMDYVEKNMNSEKDEEVYKRICCILASEEPFNVIDKPDNQGRILINKNFKNNCKFEQRKVISIGEGNSFSVISSPEVFENYRNAKYGFSLLSDIHKIR